MGFDLGGQINGLGSIELVFYGFAPGISALLFDLLTAWIFLLFP
jgi:hypothetical protein